MQESRYEVLNGAWFEECNLNRRLSCRSFAVFDSMVIQQGLLDGGSRCFAGSMPNFFMREISVVRLIPMRAAAPSGPPTRPLVTLKRRTISRSEERRVGKECRSRWS